MCITVLTLASGYTVYSFFAAHTATHVPLYPLPTCVCSPAKVWEAATKVLMYDKVMITSHTSPTYIVSEKTWLHTEVWGGREQEINEFKSRDYLSAKYVVDWRSVYKQYFVLCNVYQYYSVHNTTHYYTVIIRIIHIIHIWTTLQHESACEPGMWVIVLKSRKLKYFDFGCQWNMKMAVRPEYRRINVNGCGRLCGESISESERKDVWEGNGQGN